jgi:tetraacyldisaccharide 4'-kinase
MKSASAARPLLWPLVPAYRLALALRDLQLRTGLKRVRRLRWPVVSIGNLSTGGAGKTPLAIALAQALTSRGLHVDVLSRGYGRRSSTLPVLVDPSGTTRDFGDEPLLIAREAHVPVFVAAVRYEAGMLAERAAPSSLGLHLLDDGFQHRQLARDLDILLISRRDLNDHLLPAGNLREASPAALRAHVIAIPADEPEVETKLRSIGWQGPVWRIRRRMEIPHVDGPVAAFCGIARPDQFFLGLESEGVKLAGRTAFADHHNYTVPDLARIESEARGAGAKALLTTEKDHIRLGGLTATLPILAVPLRVEIENESAAIDWLLHSLNDPA